MTCKSCDCDKCTRHREYEDIMKILNSFPEQEGVTVVKGFFERIYSDLNHVEMDNDVNKSIIEGSWPTADENIKHAREKYQNRNNKS